MTSGIFCALVLAGAPALPLQVALDRAHFSPGEIDGKMGPATRRAQAAFLAAGGRTGDLADGGLTTYVITEDDVRGPFLAIPEDMMEKAQLPALGYTSALEAIAEAFHASPALLEALNPEATFQASGETVRVPAVGREPLPRATRVIVDRSDSSVQVIADSGAVARFPATMGSEYDPLPIGEWTIADKTERPAFNYNPDLFWDADPTHAKAKLAPGANNPVGLVWIGISKPHWGIHGTAEPATIGRTQSHGCVRLTNWDALDLAAAVSKGTPVVFQE
jgi:lipoprotein-anchoring transpeptidase ErfK/SrfK